MKGLKNPQQQGFAIAGLILGILGTIGLVGVILYFLFILIFFGGIMGLAIFGAAASSNANTGPQRTQQPATATRQQVNDGQMQVTFSRVSSTIDTKTIQLKRLPNAKEGNDAIKQARIQDPWKKEVMFTPKGEFNYEMRSAGADGIFQNNDDVIKEGKLSSPIQRMIGNHVPTSP